MNNKALPMGRNRILALDGIRGIAVLMVMSFHFAGTIGFNTRIENAIHAIVMQGWVGVELFFVLSGFLITRILLESRLTSIRALLSKFYVRRVLRIVPLYYGAIIAVFLIGTILPGFFTEGHRQFMKDQSWLWLYGVNIGQSFYGIDRFRYDTFAFTHFWTLAVEEHFYLFWPPLLLWIRRERILAVCTAIIILGLALTTAGYLGFSGWPFAITATIRQCGSLAMGAALAVIAMRDTNHQFCIRMSWLLMIVSTAAFVLIKLRIPSVPSWFDPILGRFLAGVAFTGLVSLIVFNPIGRVAVFFENPSLRFFGKYSYGLYVFHGLLFSLFQSILIYINETTGIYRLAVLGMFLAGFGVSTALSWLSWHFFERPILDLKRHFSYEQPRHFRSQEGSDQNTSCSATIRSAV